MTNAERQTALDTVEKNSLKSKKFLAWFIQQLLMASMAIVALVTQKGLGWPLASFMVGLVFMMGASTMWYLGKQAALDTAVRGFAMLGSAPKELAEKFRLEEKKEGGI
jgi:hypothetical protein